MNLVILALHIAAICSLTLFTLRLGKESSLAWLSLLSITMNLFVLKEITLFGLHVTPSDPLSVGYLLALNLIQEFFGKSTAQRGIWLAFFMGSAFTLLSYLHLLYQPNMFDTSQPHFVFLLQPLGRLMCASLLSFWIVQWVETAFFAKLRQKTQGHYLTARIFLSLLLATGLDTILFSFLGLYGVVADLGDVILLSWSVKLLIICFSTPFVLFSKWCIRYELSL